MLLIDNDAWLRSVIVSGYAMKTLLALLAFAGVLGPAVAATVGFIRLRADGIVPADADRSAWATWAPGDGLGAPTSSS